MCRYFPCMTNERGRRFRPATVIGLVVAAASFAGLFAGLGAPEPGPALTESRPVPEVRVSRPPEPTPVAIPTPEPYDPLAKAEASIGRTVNLFAVIPPMCYTKTGPTSNVCWVCHTEPAKPNGVEDVALQEKYDFPLAATLNRWKNLFRDRTQELAAISDAEILAYVREDNYSPLRAALAKNTDYPGYRPDLDFARGFDEDGFARDGSGWRAFRYKPFPGAFWPTQGSTDDVMVRLPERFRRDQAGNDAREVYRINLAILEAAIGASPETADGAVDRPVGLLDEGVAGIDLDGDGRIAGRATRMRGLPRFYVGAAHDVEVHRYLFPEGTEFLHSVRYLDPDAPAMCATRMKELRYSRKETFLPPEELAATYARMAEEEEAERAEGEEEWPGFQGLPKTGYANELGWRIQGFIEDAHGRLRVQTEEEHLFCMGCHAGVGVTVDSTFAMARKLPGPKGWKHQDLSGIPDAPQAGRATPEVLEYFVRADGGDEYRGNEELSQRFFPNGRLDEAAVRRAAPGGDRDLAWLLAPSRPRALALDKAYLAIVREQRFDQGRDPVVRPLTNVHQEIEKGTSTELKEAGHVYRDGRLWLDWPSD